MTVIKTKFTRESSNAIAFAELCLVLSTQECSRKELVEKTGISDSALRGWLRYLKNRNLIYICEYRKGFNLGAPLHIYSWNHNFEHKDVVKPRRKSEAAYSKKYRRRKLLKQLQGIWFRYE